MALRQLQDEVSGMADEPPAGLEQPLLQARQRPALDGAGATGLVGLLLYACTISSAPLAPGQELARHQERDRYARAKVPKYMEQYERPPGGCSTGNRDGLGPIPPFIMIPLAAVVLVVATPLLIARGVDTGKERQRQYDVWYDQCMNAPPLETPSEPPPTEEPSARVFSG